MRNDKIEHNLVVLALGGFQSKFRLRRLRRLLYLVSEIVAYFNFPRVDKFIMDLLEWNFWAALDDM